MTFSRMNGIFSSVLMCACASTAVHAAPISYSISFTPVFGSPLPSSGAFSYDWAQPLDSRFSNFIISWSGQLYDFTSNANLPVFQGTAPVSCIPTPDSAGVFFALTSPGGCPGLIGNIWQANETISTGSSQFRFFLIDVSLGGWGPRVNGVGAGTAQTPTIEGRFTVSPSEVPEPSTPIMMLTGALALLGGWKRFTRRSPARACQLNPCRSRSVTI